MTFAELQALLRRYLDLRDEALKTTPLHIIDELVSVGMQIEAAKQPLSFEPSAKCDCFYSRCEA